jgi:hypothetical protein
LALRRAIKERFSPVDALSCLLMGDLVNHQLLEVLVWRICLTPG